MVPNDSVLKEHTANKVREKNMFAIPPHQKPEERFLCSTNCHKSYTRIANMSFPTPGNRNYAVWMSSFCIRLGKLLMAVTISISDHIAYLLSHQVGWGFIKTRPHSISPIASSHVSLRLLSLAFQTKQHTSCCIKLGELLMDVIISISGHIAHLLSHQIGQAPYSCYH